MALAPIWDFCAVYNTQWFRFVEWAQSKDFPLQGLSYNHLAEYLICLLFFHKLVPLSFIASALKLLNPPTWLIGAAGHHMTLQCQARLLGSHHMATPAHSTYLGGAATWRQKRWSYTPQHNLKYHTFLFVEIAEIGSVSVLSSNQNDAYIGCRLKPETLTCQI